jgi:hypothetical protein
MNSEALHSMWSSMGEHEQHSWIQDAHAIPSHAYGDVWKKLPSDEQQQWHDEARSHFKEQMESSYQPFAQVAHSRLGVEHQFVSVLHAIGNAGHGQFIDQIAPLLSHPSESIRVGK